MTTTFKVMANEARIETCTSQLRFVQRDKSRVLQQLWTWVSSGGGASQSEWRDVPFVPEGKL